MRRAPTAGCRAKPGRLPEALSRLRARAARRPGAPSPLRAGPRNRLRLPPSVCLLAAAVIGNTLGTKNLNSYDPGQAGQAERVLSRPGVIQRYAESVLIQTRDGRTVASDPQARTAIRQVTVALQRMPGVATDIQSPLA